VIFPVEEKSFTAVHVSTGGRWLRESLTNLKEQLPDDPDDIRVASSRNKVLCKLVGYPDKVAAVRVLSPELLQISVDYAFEHARCVC
jgi:hypothetical protein